MTKTIIPRIFGYQIDDGLKKSYAEKINCINEQKLASEMFVEILMILSK